MVVIGVVATLLIVAAVHVAWWRSDYIRTLLTGEPVEVSMINLISDPGHYDGVKVRVIGYMKLEFEGDRLCASREASDVGEGRSCVWLSRTASMPPGAAQYELIEGTFSAGEHGHMGLFSGSLKNVTRAMTWSSPLSLKYSQPEFYLKEAVRPDDLAKCKLRGGAFEDVGKLQACVVGFHDADKACTDDDQCEGACIYINDGKRGPPPFASVSGQCQARSLQLGCFGEVRHGSVGSMNCYDTPSAE
jgi:hypothetical protein